MSQATIFALTHHSESVRHRSNRHGALHVDFFSGTHSPATPSITPAPGGEQSVPRGETVVIVVRSILLVVAAVSVIGNQQLFRVPDRTQAGVPMKNCAGRSTVIVQLMDQKRVEEELAPTTLKQRQDRLEQNASGLTDLTTSTINGKTTVVAPEPARAESR